MNCGGNELTAEREKGGYLQQGSWWLFARRCLLFVRVLSVDCGFALAASLSASYSLRKGNPHGPHKEPHAGPRDGPLRKAVIEGFIRVCHGFDGIEATVHNELDISS